MGDAKEPARENYSSVGELDTTVAAQYGGTAKPHPGETKPVTRRDRASRRILISGLLALVSAVSIAFVLLLVTGTIHPDSWFFTRPSPNESAVDASSGDSSDAPAKGPTEGATADSAAGSKGAGETTRRALVFLSDVDSSSYPDVIFYASVQDEEGAAIKGLDASSASITEVDALGHERADAITGVELLSKGGSIYVISYASSTEASAK